MTYPLSTDVSAGQPTAVAHYNTLRADALRLGQAEADCVTTGVMLRRYARGVRLQYLATNRLRVPYVTTDPPTLMINGFMCQAGANVDLPAGLFSGGAATWYVFANRTAGSTTFTLSVNTSGSEGTDQRVIGEVSYDGANIISIKDYFASPLGDADYSSGWFAAAYNNTYTKAHGLNQSPRLVVVEHSANAAGTGEIVPVFVNSASAVMSCVGYDAVNIYITTANNATNGVVFSTRRASAGGYLRIQAWR
jgi:hypothetical protein